MAGFGIKESIASAEEVVNAINNQNAKTKKPTKAQLKFITDTYGEQLPTLLEHLGINSVEEMTGDMVGKVLQKIKGNK